MHMLFGRTNAVMLKTILLQLLLWDPMVAINVTGHYRDRCLSEYHKISGHIPSHDYILTPYTIHWLNSWLDITMLFIISLHKLLKSWVYSSQCSTYMIRIENWSDICFAIVIGFPIDNVAIVNLFNQSVKCWNWPENVWWLTAVIVSSAMFCAYNLCIATSRHLDVAGSYILR